MRRVNKFFTLLAAIFFIAQPSVLALSGSDVNSLIGQYPYYDPGTTAVACEGAATSGASGSVATAADALSQQTGLDPKWRDLILKDADKYGADPLTMASILYWENRGWPAYKSSGWSDDPASGMGPWQFTLNTWQTNFNGDVDDPVDSTDAAAQFIKGMGGVAGAPDGSISQDFGQGKNLPSMATVMKNYNAGSGTYRSPAIAQYKQPGRVWYQDGQGPWSGSKPDIIDDYIVAGTYIYYQIGTGQQVSYKGTDSYVQEALAKQAQIKGYSFGGPSGVSGNCSSACSNANGDPGKVVVIDPGHGPNFTEVDAQTGLRMIESHNVPEIQEVWDVAQKVKSQLEADGYKVLLTKSDVEGQGVTFRDRANIANNNGAAIAVSIHDDHGQNYDSFKEIYPQEVGAYRGSDAAGNKTVFTDQAVAQKSQEYAKVFQQERQKAEGGSPVIKLDDSFSNRAGFDPGNIPMVQLFSKVPWVYNEVGASGNLSQSQENKYAEGIINGVEKSIGSTNQVAATNGSNTSADCAAVNGSVVDTAIGLAWPSGEHGPDKADATLAYQAALPKYNDATNDYSDCGGFVATVMHASGADKSYVGVYVPNQYDYVNGTGASKYKIIKNIRDTSRLEAGDILMDINT